MSRKIDFDDGFTSESPSEDIPLPASDVVVTPAGGIESTNVQDALEELDSEVSSIPIPITYKGTWDASTNTPTLSDSDTDRTGWLYQVNVAGAVDFGSGEISFEVGDKVVNNGTTWDKWDMTDNVFSVNGQTGIVELDKSDVGLGNVDNTSDAEKNEAEVTLKNKTLENPVVDVVVLEDQANTPANPSAGFHKLYTKSSTGKLTLLDSAGNEVIVGSGDGIETFSASYSLSSNQSLTGGTTVLNLANKLWDTHNMVTTGGSWKATVPAGGGGIYEINLSISTNTANCSFYIRKNGTSYKYITHCQSIGLGSGSVKIPLADSDYIDFVCNTSVTATGGSTPYVSHFSMIRAGSLP